MLVSLSASSPPYSARDTDPPRCLIVSRRKPISDPLRRPLSGDSAGAVNVAVVSRSFGVAATAVFVDLFGEPVNLELAAAGVLVGSGTVVAVFISVGNLQIYECIHVIYNF